jgi:hypothetical protein
VKLRVDARVFVPEVVDGIVNVINPGRVAEIHDVPVSVPRLLVKERSMQTVVNPSPLKNRLNVSTELPPPNLIHVPPTTAASPPENVKTFVPKELRVVGPVAVLSSVSPPLVAPPSSTKKKVRPPAYAGLAARESEMAPKVIRTMARKATGPLARTGTSGSILE